MSKTKSFRAKVDIDKKVLSFYDKEAFLSFIQTIPGEIDITVSEVSSRTHWQNRYYWAIISDFMQDNAFGGYTKEEVPEDYVAWADKTVPFDEDMDSHAKRAIHKFIRRLMQD